MLTFRASITIEGDNKTTFLSAFYFSFFSGIPFRETEGGGMPTPSAELVQH